MVIVICTSVVEIVIENILFSSLVFLQLYHSAYFGSTTEKPLLANSDQLKLAIKKFDRMPPYETHKVGFQD